MRGHNRGAASIEGSLPVSPQGCRRIVFAFRGDGEQLRLCGRSSRAPAQPGRFPGHPDCTVRTAFSHVMLERLTSVTRQACADTSRGAVGRAAVSRFRKVTQQA
jgi:hypothetical protein